MFVAAPFQDIHFKEFKPMAVAMAEWKCLNNRRSIWGHSILAMVKYKLILCYLHSWTKKATVAYILLCLLKHLLEYRKLWRLIGLITKHLMNIFTIYLPDFNVCCFCNTAHYNSTDKANQRKNVIYPWQECNLRNCVFSECVHTGPHQIKPVDLDIWWLLKLAHQWRNPLISIMI